MTGSLYSPDSWGEVQASKVSPGSFGTTGQAAVNTTTNIDYTLTDDIFLKSIEVIAKNASFGDKITITIRDSGGSTTDTIVSSYNVSMSFDKFLSYDSVVPKKILATSVIRVAYLCTSLTVPVDVAVNCISFNPTL